MSGSMRDELIDRLVARHAAELNLSSGAVEELRLAVEAHPNSFVQTVEDDAFYALVSAFETFEEARKNDEFLDDETFFKQRKARSQKLTSACLDVLDIDEYCTDAETAVVVVSGDDPDAVVQKLQEIEDELEEQFGTLEDQAKNSELVRSAGDAWADALLRPRMRLLEVLERALFQSARYRMAAHVAERLLTMSPSDVVGARHTQALCFARLEDENGLDRLDARFSRQGDSWMGLSRMLLMYKLGRLGAAKRALLGFDRLSNGGLYAFLRPVLVDTYMLGRPPVMPYNYEEAVLAVHEADPIVVDAPDFVSWVNNQPEAVASAEAYAKRKGLDW